jgi:hypothetical protein
MIKIRMGSPAALMVLALLLVGCTPDSGTPGGPAPEVEAGDGMADGAPDGSVGAVEVGDWSAYGEPERDEWKTDPLTPQRWVHVSAELACAGRANHGDEGSLEDSSRRILAHHRTTAEAVMTFGIGVNQDPEQAHTLGELVATAAETCR